MACRYFFARNSSRAFSNSLSEDRVSVPSRRAFPRASSNRFMIEATAWSRSFVASTSACATMSRASSNCPMRYALSARSRRPLVRGSGVFIASASARTSRSLRRAASASSPCRRSVSSCALSCVARSAACSISPASRCPRAFPRASVDAARSAPSTDVRISSASFNVSRSLSRMSDVNSSSVRCASPSAFSYSFAFIASFASAKTSRRCGAAIPRRSASSSRPRDDKIFWAEE